MVKIIIESDNPYELGIVSAAVAYDISMRFSSPSESHEDVIPQYDNFDEACKISADETWDFITCGNGYGEWSNIKIKIEDRQKKDE